MIRNYLDFAPIISEETFIAETAIITGRCEIKKNANIWYGAVLRGDVNSITVGENTNIQDNTVVHCADDYATIIGDDVTIGHAAIIHGCEIGNNTMIGMGAIVLNGAKVGSNVIVAAGALVTGGKIIPDNSLVVGSPAKVIRELTKEEVKSLADSALKYVEVSKGYK